MAVQYLPLSPQHFDAVITLGNQVHGENYLDAPKIADYYRRGLTGAENLNWLAFDGVHLAGFRLTFAAEHWQPDQWCSPSEWGVAADKAVYFKCSAVDAAYRGQHIGKQLLQQSIQAAKRQGAQAGIAHIWLASPNNSAYRYFSACGGELVREHPGKWQALSLNDGYQCPVCGDLCLCTAAEMIIRFGK